MKLPSKISFVIFFNSAYEISFTFLMFSSNLLNYYKNFLKIHLRSESYPPYGKWIRTFMKGCDIDRVRDIISVRNIDSVCHIDSVRTVLLADFDWFIKEVWFSGSCWL